MNLIFLDIDGVMNCQLFYTEREFKRKFTIKYWLNEIGWRTKKIIFGNKPKSLKDYKPTRGHKTFEYRFQRLKEETCKTRWGWLNELCKETNSQVVISSVWRRHFSVAEWNMFFRKMGLDIVCAGVTETHRTLRGEEIADYLAKYPLYLPSNYVIIDDDSDMLEEQKSHFFQTDNYSGITPTTIYKIKRYLKKEGV